MKEYINSKKYFIFDLDGTLVNLEELNYQSFRKSVLKNLNIQLSYEEYLKYFAGAGSKKGFERYLKSIDSQYSVIELQKYYRELKREELKNNFNNVVKLIKGADKYLEMLKKDCKKIALGTSNAAEFSLEIIKRLDIDKFFDAKVTIEDVKNTKPAPDIFLKGLELIAGNIEDGVVFEDSPTGVQAAINSGMEYVVVHTKGGNDDVVKDRKFVIQDYFELI